MRLVTVILFASVLTLSIPTLATADDDLDSYTVHAAFVSAVYPEAGCDGWWSDVIVRFRWAMTTMDATFSLTLTDASDEVLETVTWTDILVRGADTWPTQVYHYEGDWMAFAPPGDYMVSLTVSIEGAYADGVDLSTESGSAPFHCDVVATENATLSDIRALYR